MAVVSCRTTALGASGAGNNGGREEVNAYLREADVVLLVGTRANATDTDGFTAPSRDSAKIVAIDIDASRAGRNYPGALDLVGDADQILGQLADALPPLTKNHEPVRTYEPETGLAASWPTAAGGRDPGGSGGDRRASRRGGRSGHPDAQCRDVLAGQRGRPDGHRAARARPDGLRDPSRRRDRAGPARQTGARANR
ncbi:hypothetical protein [Fodinicola feengrottensis]|uniref:hypothetical protein n=1 Tax=Fodinicola feengrottensis TaxID=435914 RepID=UPI0036F1F8E7